MQDWREGRRLRAWELLEAGWRQVEIAEALGVSEGAVSQWVKRAREGGVDALRRHPAPGAKSKLTLEQLAELPSLLAQGAEAYGYRGNVWTHSRIAAVIEEASGAKYHENHMTRILHKIRWSRQKPRRRATQRDEGAIEQWRAEDWPSILKEALEAGQTIVFADEAGFRLLTALAYTYAPRGQTPILQVRLTHDHLSVIGAITLNGTLFSWIQDHSVKGPDVVRFLKHLLAHISGSILLIGDNLPAHRAQPVKEFLASGRWHRHRPPPIHDHCLVHAANGDGPR